MFAAVIGIGPEVLAGGEFAENHRELSSATVNMPLMG